MRNPYDSIGRLGTLLAILGGLNWLLVGIFQWNLVQWIFTQSGTQTVDNTGERVVYIVVGAGAILAIPMLAATLARTRRREVRSYESDSVIVERPAREEHEQAEARANAGVAPAPVPLRIVPEQAVTSGSAPAEAPAGAAASGRPSVDSSLRYGAVEEADDEYGFEERRAA